MSMRRRGGPLTITGVNAFLAFKFFHDRYEELFGFKFSQTSELRQRAAGQMTRLVERDGLSEVKLRMEVYFADTWLADHGGFSMLGFLKVQQRLATTTLANQLRSWFILTEEQQAECESALAFFCRRHLARRKSSYQIPADKRIIALRGLGAIVTEIGARDTRRRMAAYLDDDWQATHGGLRLSEFLKAHQNFAAKSVLYAKPPSWDSWQARHGKNSYPSTAKLYPGTSTPMFLGVDDDE